MRRATETAGNVVIEIPFQAEKAYANPFTDVMLDVAFTDPDGRPGILHSGAGDILVENGARKHPLIIC